GRLAGALGDDIDERWYRVRIGFDIEPEEANDPAKNDQQQRNDDQNALLYREDDDFVHVLRAPEDRAPSERPSGTIQSLLAARSINRLPLVTILSPAVNPATTSTSPSLVRPVWIARTASVPSSRATHTRAVSPS